MLSSHQYKADTSISSAELNYILAGCSSNLRIDGRENMDHRHYSVSYSNRSNTDMPHLLSNGSSRVTLPGSSTDILCSIHAELIHPSFTQPNQGAYELHVDILPFGALIGDKGKRRKQETEITSILQHLLLPHILQWSSLVVESGKYVWRLCIDIIILSCNGNLIDSCSAAIWGALQKLRLPKIVTPNENQQSSSDQNNQADLPAGKRNALDDVIIDSDVANSVIPDGVSECPLVITVYLLPQYYDHQQKTQIPSSDGMSESTIHRVMKKNNWVIIIDATEEEELSASAKISVSTDPSGRICGVHTHGKDSTSSSEFSVSNCDTIPFSLLNEVRNVAISASKNFWDMIEANGRDRIERFDCNVKGHEYGELLQGHFEWR